MEDKKIVQAYSLDGDTILYIQRIALERFDGNESLALRKMAEEHKRFAAVINGWNRHQVERSE